MIGTQMLHYQITRKLGVGGMGEVFEAQDLKLGRTVALKFVLEGIAGNTDAMARFEREAKAVSKMDHPNVGAVFALEHDGSKTFLAMAYYQGETLRERLDRERLGVADAVRISLEIARGLEHAHTHGVTHRDVKPANIFLARQANGSDLVKLLDFGLARLEDASRMMTRPGATTGTLMYMAPEQMRGETIAHRVDVWAWGAVTFEMLAGRPPFAQENIGALLTAILNLEPDPLETLNPDAPATLVGLVKQALRKNPAERLEGMGLVVQHLEAMIGGQGSGLRSWSPSLDAAKTVEPKAVATEARFKPEDFVVQHATGQTSSASDHPAFVSNANWDAPAESLVKPTPKRPWWVLAPAVLAVAVGAWVLIPKTPSAPTCKPLEKPSTVLERVLKASGNTLPLLDCGAYLHASGQADSSAYPGSLETRREVLALPSGTVMIADAVRYAEPTVPMGLMPLPKDAVKVENADLNGGQQWRSASENLTVNALNLIYLDSEAQNGKLKITSSDDPNTNWVFLTAYQAGEGSIGNLNVTTNDEHWRNFAGVLLNEDTAVFLGAGVEASPATFEISVPPGIKRYFVSGLEPGQSWQVGFAPNRNWWTLTLQPGRDGTVSSQGVVLLETPEPKPTN